jgi:hypothetical protein
VLLQYGYEENEDRFGSVDRSGSGSGGVADF